MPIRLDSVGSRGGGDPADVNFCGCVGKEISVNEVLEWGVAVVKGDNGVSSCEGVVWV